jgi:hypothetical protein
MPVKINGATSGSVTLAAPATGSDVTLTLPAASGTAALTASPTLSDPTFTGNVVWSAATLRAGYAEVLTSQTTSSATYVDLATAGPAVTLTTGTKALVIFSAISTVNAQARPARMSVAVSGASTVSASNNWCALEVANNIGYAYTLNMSYVFTGLTAGSNTFTTKYQGDGTGVAEFSNRRIIVIDLGS